MVALGWEGTGRFTLPQFLSLERCGFHAFSSRLLPQHSCRDQDLPVCVSHPKPEGKCSKMPVQNTILHLSSHQTSAQSRQQQQHIDFPEQRPRWGQDSRNITRTVGTSSTQLAHSKAHEPVSWGTFQLTKRLCKDRRPSPPDRLPS